MPIRCVGSGSGRGAGRVAGKRADRGVFRCRLGVSGAGRFAVRVAEQLSEKVKLF